MNQNELIRQSRGAFRMGCECPVMRRFIEYEFIDFLVSKLGLRQSIENVALALGLCG